MSVLLNVAYVMALAIALPRIAYMAARQGKYRQGWGQKLFGLAPIRTSRTKCVWLHGVSVGEIQVSVSIRKTSPTTLSPS